MLGAIFQRLIYLEKKQLSMSLAVIYTTYLNLRAASWQEGKGSW